MSDEGEANIANPSDFNQFLCNKVCSLMFLRQTTVFEIFNLIKQLNCNKSSGADGVYDFFCKNWRDGDRSYILSVLYNACFKFSVFPSNLKIENYSCL